MRKPAFVLLALLLSVPAFAAAQGGESLVRVGTPIWWLGQVESNASQGRLYFATTVENVTPGPIHAELSFRSYLANGERFAGCESVYTEIAPRERALLTCNRSIVERDKVEGLQVTTRVREVRRITPPRPVAAQAIETGLEREADYIDSSDFQAFARVRTTGSADVEAVVHFGFYAEDGTQVATCKSGTVTVEPEVAIRVNCWATGVSVPKGAPQPVRVRAEVRSSGW